MRAVPVVNENDTVATSEIRYGDNDRLAARVATMAGADLLVLLSDIDGLYTAPPAIRPDAQLIPVVPRITPEIEAMAGGAALRAVARRHAHQDRGRARSPTAGGTHMVIADGRVKNPLAPSPTARAARGSSRPRTRLRRARNGSPARSSRKGVLYLDAGAARAHPARARACCRPASRASRGVRARRRGASMRDAGRREIGRGLVAYDADHADRILGRSSRDIEAMLGYAGRAEMVHRDDMALARRVAVWKKQRT